MATPAGQAKAQALNAKLEGEARVAIDELERKYMRTQAKSCTNSLQLRVICFVESADSPPAFSRPYLCSKVLRRPISGSLGRLREQLRDASSQSKRIIAASE
jgi:hypothetical protein